MAYKFQLGAAVLSGSLVQEGNLEAQGSGEFTSLKIADDGAIGAIGDLDMITLDAGNDVTIASDLDLIVAEGKLKLGSVAVTSTAAELNLLDGVSGLVQADFTKLAAVDASAAELNLLDAVARGSIIHGNASGVSALLAKGNANTVLSSDGSDISYTAVSNAMLAGSIANAKLANSTISGKDLGANLDALAVDDSSIEYSAGSAFNGSAASTIRVKALGVTNAMLAGSIANAKLANDGITIAGADTSLGGSITSAAILNTDMGGAFTIGSQADDLATFKGPVTIEGNLTVLGSSVEIDAGFVVTSSVKFEGTTPDGNETELIATNPTADRTITLPDLSGHVPLIAGAATAASIAVTAAEFALLDGGNSRGTDALADGDGFMHNDNGTMKQTNVLKMFEYTVAKVSGDVAIADTGAATIQANAVEGSMLNDNIVSGLADIGAALASTDEMIVSDNGAIKRTDMSRIKTFVEAGFSASTNVAIKAAGGTLAIGVNYFEDMSSDGEDAVTLPASPIVGQAVKVKAPSDCSSARFITINRAGSQTIDGAASIRLESPFAAVELVYVASDLWRVF